MREQARRAPTVPEGAGGAVRQATNTPRQGLPDSEALWLVDRGLADRGLLDRNCGAGSCTQAMNAETQDDAAVDSAPVAVTLGKAD